jgi:DNA-binding protein HU-beta
MNKTELVDAIAKEANIAKSDAAKTLDALINTVHKSLKKGEDVAITGFGKFHVVKRAARQGVNPRTGEKVKIKASKAPKFTPGAGLKNAVNPKK